MNSANRGIKLANEPIGNRLEVGLSGKERVTDHNGIPENQESLDAVRRHLCDVLGFDYGTLDLLRGNEFVSYKSFSAAPLDETMLALIESLQDESEQPLMVAHSAFNRSVKHSPAARAGRCHRRQDHDSEPATYPYAVVPVTEDGKVIRGLLRVVSFDQGRVIGDEDLMSLSAIARNLAQSLPTGSRDNAVFKHQENLSPAFAETILVVHANRLVRRRLSRILSGHYQVLETDQSQRALYILRSEKVDLVVMDAELEAAPGMTFCQSLKESPQWKHVPVILVIPDSSPGCKIEGLNQGAEDCLSESCHEAELIARCGSSLRLRKTERDLATQLTLLEDYAQRLEEATEAERQANLKLSKDRQSLDQLNRELEQRRKEVDQRRLEAEVRRNQDTLLHRISNTIRQSFNIDQNLREMLEDLAGWLSLDCCFVVLPVIDEPEDTVRCEYVSSGDFSVVNSDLDLKILTAYESILDVDSVLIVNDVSRDRRLEPFKKEILSECPVRSLFYVPITYEKKLLGLLGGHKCESEAQWTRDNETFLKSVADQVAIGVTNARLYARVERQATTDGLTGLANHRTGQEKLSEQLRVAERYQRNLAVLMIDVDHFKSINDTFGHPAGDTVLKAVARLIKSDCRDVDLPVRYGGEEFLLILPEVNQEGAVVVAERIRRKLAHEVISHGDIDIAVTASVGVASYPEDAQTQHQLLDLADKALYLSKRMGRNQVHTGSDLQFADLQGSSNETVKAAQDNVSSGASDAVSDKEELVPEVVEMVKALASALYSKSEYNKVHHLETARFAELLAKVLGLPQQEVEQIRVATLLHDVGVLSIPEEIINKPGLVNDQEMEVIMQHPALGAQLLRPVRALKEICDIVENHQECWDGTGYPLGLKGEQIPLAARIVAIVDAYHAMISQRPYRAAMTPEQAVKALKNGAGSQWDPFLVDMFIAVLDSLNRESHTS